MGGREREGGDGAIHSVAEGETNCFRKKANRERRGCCEFVRRAVVANRAAQGASESKRPSLLDKYLSRLRAGGAPLTPRARQNDAASRVHISRGVRPQGRPPRRPRGAAAPADPMPQRARVPGARGPAPSIGNDPPRVVVTFSPPPFLSHPQGAELMAKYGVRVPPGIACKTPDEVAAAAAKLGGASGEVVVKSQVRPRTPTTRAAFKNTTPRARARPLSPPSRPVVPRRI